MATATNTDATATTNGSGKKFRVLIPLPQIGFDPTEAAVPWAVLNASGDVEITVASPAGGASRCDPIMICGNAFYALKWTLRADAKGRAAYAAMLASGVLDNTPSFDEAFCIEPTATGAADGGGAMDEAAFTSRYDALLLPGGHCPDMVRYLEDRRLWRAVAAFNKTGKPIAAICHGVVVAGWSGVLKGRRATVLPAWMETIGHNLTRAWMGNYFRTYAHTSAEAQVMEVCGKFVAGPWSLARDNEDNWEKVGFTVEDGNIVTGRWPGDSHALGHALLNKLRREAAATAVKQQQWRRSSRNDPVCDGCRAG